MGQINSMADINQLDNDIDKQYLALKSLIREPLLVVSLTTGKIAQANMSFERMFGWSSAQIKNMSLLDLKLCDDQSIKKITHLLLRKKTIKLTDILLSTKEGGLLSGELSAKIISLSSGLVALITFYYSHALMDLDIHEEAFSAVFDPMSDVITVSELDTANYVRVNNTMATILGCDVNSIINQTEYSVGLWINDTERLELVNRIRQTQQAQVLESALYNPESGYTPIKFSVDIGLFNGREYLFMVGHDISNLRKAEKKAIHLAYHDPLTNLPNRALLFERLEQQINLVQRYGLHAAILFLDLDHFKNINDSIGHYVGDAVLKIITTRLKASVRVNDLVTRHGGDEFVILLTKLEGDFDEVETQVLQTAERIREILCEPMVIDAHRLQVSTSIGVAIIPEHGTTTSDLIKRADIALYKAKERGRNMIATFRRSMQSAVVQRMRIEAKMRMALQNKEFKLTFHPQVFSRTHEIIGAEVLIRWVNGKDVFSPNYFINILEETQLIIEVGEWVLFESCRLYAKLMSHPSIALLDFKLCVNVSPKQVQHDNFYAVVEKALSKYAIPKHAITLEVTERIVIQGTSSTIQKMYDLKKLGVNFAIDDFGIGYSSLAYLKKLPIDMLKIDKAFVDTITTDTHDAGIVSAIITMANSLDFEVIAEGVETVDQLSILEEKGCYLYQGFLFSKPLEFESLRALLVAQSSRQV